MKKKLHELIQIAKKGKKFKARHPLLKNLWSENHFLIFETFSKDAIVHDWEYQEIREPQVVEFDLTVNDSGFFEWHQPEASIKLNGKKWKVVCAEVMDD